VGSNLKEDTQQRCIRFGAIAVELGLVTPADLQNAMQIQVQEDLDGKRHRLIGRILFDDDLITAQQIEDVFSELCWRCKESEAR